MTISVSVPSPTKTEGNIMKSTKTYEQQADYLEGLASRLKLVKGENEVHMYRSVSDLEVIGNTACGSPACAAGWILAVTDTGPAIRLRDYNDGADIMAEGLGFHSREGMEGFFRTSEGKYVWGNPDGDVMFAGYTSWEEDDGDFVFFGDGKERALKVRHLAYKLIKVAGRLRELAKDEEKGLA